jgi:diguanylate cyclase (GGDEF)-like protein
VGVIVGWMQPNDVHAARRTLRLLVFVALVATVVTAPVSASGAAHAEPWLLAATVANLVLCVAVAAWATSHGWPIAWLVCPVLAVSAITMSGVATHDASVGAQVFFIFAALWGGALLPRQGTILMVALAVAGEAVLVLSQLPVRDALVDLVYVGGAICTVAYLLAHASARTARRVDRLHKRASSDHLTGLVNRASFDEALNASATDETPVGTALVLVDIDRFKTINDTWGHPAGDQVLVQLAHVLTAAARRDDVVCRLGGDELAVLMPGCSLATAHRRALDIVESVRETSFILPGAGAVPISVSAGVAHRPTHASSAEDLYAVADAALYAAKRAGRDQVVQHTA